MLHQPHASISCFIWVRLGFLWTKVKWAQDCGQKFIKQFTTLFFPTSFHEWVQLILETQKLSYNKLTMHLTAG